MKTHGLMRPRGEAIPTLLNSNPSLAGSPGRRYRTIPTAKFTATRPFGVAPPLDRKADTSVYEISASIIAMRMNRLLLSLATVLFIACVAFGQSADLGEQITAEDAALGANPGVIHVTRSGTISQGKVSLSVGHDLVCANQVTISLNAGS